MSSEIRLIQQSYRDIGEVEPRDAFKAYADFHEVVSVLGPRIDGGDLASIETCTDYDLAETAQDAIQQTRSCVTRIGRQTMLPYFRGSGIISVGNNKGDIFIVDYAAESLNGDGDEDPLLADNKEADYRHTAIDRMGLALAVARSGIVKDHIIISMAHDRIIEELANKYGANTDIHLGYAYRRNKSYGTIVVGAAGMLPSLSTASSLTARYEKELARDKKRGTLTREVDEFIGLHNTVAAEMVADSVARPVEPWDVRSFGLRSLPLSPEDFPGVRLH